MARITIYTAHVRRQYCDSHSRIIARSREELWAKILDGQRRGELGDVLETGTETVEDPDAREDALREYFRAVRTTCALPPVSDLLLIRDAKRVDPADFEAVRAIDPYQALEPRTRARLERIRAEKLNAYLRQVPD